MDALVANYEQGRSKPLAVLSRLDSWPRPDDVEERRFIEQRIQTLRIQVLGDLSAALQDLMAQVEPAFRESLQAGQWVEADRWLHQEVPDRLLQVAGLPSPGELPNVQEAAGFQRWYARGETQLEQDLERRMGALREALLAWVTESVGPEIQRATEQGDFVLALDLATLRMDPAMKALAQPARGLPSDVVRKQLREWAGPLLEPHRSAIEARWQEFAQRLEAWIAQREPELLARIESEHVEGMDSVLQGDFDRSLQRLGLRWERIPPAWTRGVAQSLTDAKLRLQQEGQHQRTAVARNKYEQDAERGAQLLAERQYSQTERLWRDRLDAPWRVAVFGEMQRDLREVELLLRYEARVRAALAASWGREQELWLGGFRRRGVLLASDDPQSQGVPLSAWPEPRDEPGLAASQSVAGGCWHSFGARRLGAAGRR